MERTRKKMHYNQTDDYLMLYRWSSFVMLADDGDDVLFPSFFLALHFFLALFCVACNIWFVQPHNGAYSSYPTTGFFFSLFFFFFSIKRPTTATHNVTTTYFPSSSLSEFYEYTTRPSKTMCGVCMFIFASYTMDIYIFIFILFF